MELLLSARGLQYSFGKRQLFTNIDISLSRGERVALVGHNGVGKSTLMKILAGQISPEKGEVIPRRSAKLSMVHQYMPADYLARTPLELLEEKLAYSRDEWRAPLLLQEINLLDCSMIPCSGLSGGQKNCLMLLLALSESPDILFLDEPGNHMDLLGLLYFEKLLKTYDGALLMISHDREILDRTTSKTLFLRDIGLQMIDRPCSMAYEKLKEMDEAMAHKRDEQEKEIYRIEESAKRLMTWGKVYDNEMLSKRGQNMQKRAERLKDERVEISQGNPYCLELSPCIGKNKRVLTIYNLAVSPPGVSKEDCTLFNLEHLELHVGERLALLGKNGSGKSSLIEELVKTYGDKKKETVEISFNPQVTLGHYDQEQHSVLKDKKQSLWSFLRKELDISDREITGLLMSAGFSYEDKDKQIDVLSGGERARLIFMILRAQKPNFLILDEPTNHIDLEGREELINEIKKHNIPMIVTSHDRYFLQQISTRFVLISENKLCEIPSAEIFYTKLEEEVFSDSI